MTSTASNFHPVSLADGRVLMLASDLFGRESTGGTQGHLSDAKGDDGVWRTIDGTHVFIRGGKITKGPHALTGKTVAAATKGEPAKSEPKADPLSHVRSPAGGKVSEVDGKFYPGGSLMPIHGMYSGQEKSASKAETAKAIVKQKEDGKAAVRSAPSAADVADARERAATQGKWDQVKNGPIGKVKYLGDKPGNTGEGSPDHTSLDKWIPFAESLGNEKLNTLTTKLEKEHRSRVDSGVASSGLADDKKVDASEWEKREPKRQAEQTAQSMPRKAGGHQKQMPNSLYARELVNTLLADRDFPGGKVENYHSVHSLMSDAAQSSAPVDTNRQLGMFAKDASGNPVEVGEKPGQTTMFGTAKPAAKVAEPGANSVDARIAKQYDPKATPELPGMTPGVKAAVEQAKGTAKESWQMTKREWALKDQLPPQKKISQSGQVPFVRTDDGAIYSGDASDFSHVLMAKRMGIPGHRITNGGFVNEGVIDDAGSQSANIMRYAAQSKAQNAVEHKQHVRSAIAAGKSVPSEVMKDYPDLGSEVWSSVYTGMDREDFAKVKPMLEKHVGNEKATHRKAIAAAGIMRGESPPVQKMLMEHLKTVAPEAHEKILADRKKGGLLDLSLSAPKPYLARCPQCRSHDIARTANVAGGRSLDRCRHCGNVWTHKDFTITAEMHSRRDG